MDPNQNDQPNQDPLVPAGDGSQGQDPIPAPQPEPMPEPTIAPEPTPTPAPTGDTGQAPMEEITPPPPMVEEHPQETPASIDQGNAGDTNPVA